MSDELYKVALFRHKEIRKQLHGGEWWFVINDVIAALTDSENPAQYLRNRDEELSKLFDPTEKGVVQIDGGRHCVHTPFLYNKSYGIRYI